MAIQVTNQNPGRITNVGLSNTGNTARVTAGTTYATNPIKVVSNYGMQPTPFSTTPVKLNGVGMTGTSGSILKSLQGPDTSGTASLLAEIQRLNAERAAIPRPVKIDIAGINARARAEAEAAVNPLYTKKLNDYLAKNALEKQRANENFNTAVTNIDEQLANTLKDSATARDRTTQDTTTNIDAVNAAQDQYQTDTGTSVDENRLAMARELAKSGLSAGMGTGGQQFNKVAADQNTQEVRTGQDAEAKKVAQTVLKARTFDDLATSDTRATTGAGKNKTAAGVDLHRMMEDLTMEEQAQRSLLESQRYIDLFQNQSAQAKKLFAEFLSGIRDPGALSATASAYGGLF